MYPGCDCDLETNILIFAANFFKLFDCCNTNLSSIFSTLASCKCFRARALFVFLRQSHGNYNLFLPFKQNIFPCDSENWKLKNIIGLVATFSRFLLCWPFFFAKIISTDWKSNWSISTKRIQVIRMECLQWPKNSRACLDQKINVATVRQLPCLAEEEGQTMLNAESPAGEIRDRRFVQTTAKAKLRYTCLNKRKELKRGDFATGSKNCCLEKSVALEL